MDADASMNQNPCSFFRRLYQVGDVSFCLPAIGVEAFDETAVVFLQHGSTYLASCYFWPLFGCCCSSLRSLGFWSVPAELLILEHGQILCGVSTVSLPCCSAAYSSKVGQETCLYGRGRFFVLFPFWNSSWSFLIFDWPYKNLPCPCTSGTAVIFLWYI